MLLHPRDLLLAFLPEFPFDWCLPPFDVATMTGLHACPLYGLI